MGGFNDLATLLPDIAAEWSDRNYPLLPTQVTVFANRKAWWKCKDCGREWNTLISTRCKLWDAGEKGLRICNSFADFSGKPSSDNGIQLMVYSIRE